MGKTILIHANCRNSTASGDFSFAGNIAKDLKIELTTSSIDIDVFLVSALDGVPRFEKLYGGATNGRVFIDGVSIGISSLETFDAVEHTVVAFIDANRCKHSAGDIVKRVISPDTKFLFIGNMNQSELSDLFSQTLHRVQVRKEQPGLYDAFHDNDILMRSAGLGPNRFGMPTITKTANLTTLTDEQAAQLPTLSYGFMYIRATDNNIRDYQLMTQYVQLTGFEHYVLVGDFSTKKSNIDSAFKLDASFRCGPIPTIQYYNSLQYPIMRRMTANASGSLVVSTGVTSTLEAMQDEKLPFYQDLSCNEEFIVSYLMAVKAIASSDSSLVGCMPQLIIELSKLLFAPKPLSNSDMARTSDLLRMSTVSQRLIITNQTILDRASGKIAPRLLGFISSARSTQDPVQLAQVCISLRKPGETGSPVYDQALRRAAYWGRLFELKVLIQAMLPADLNKTELTYGMSALHFAVKYKHMDCARTLMNAGADVNVQAKDGKTALHWAVTNADRAMIKLLIDAGAQIDTVDNDSKTPEGNAPDEGVILFIRHCYDGAHVRSSTSGA